MLTLFAMCSAMLASPVADSTTVILLGTGTPRPTPEVFGPATAVVVGSRTFLFDAGAGVMHQMVSAKLGVRGPTALFLTHLHSDHTLGLPDLIFTSWVMERSHPFGVYGPPGTQHMVDALYDAWKEDIDVRTNGLEHRLANAYRVDVHEVKPGVVYDSGGVRITAIQVPHGTWKWAYAFRVDAPDRSVVISGDTAPSEELAKLAAGVDVLVHEVYPEPGTTARGPQRGYPSSEYFRKFHVSTVELGQLAQRAKPKLLVLSHIVRMDATDDELVAGVRKGGYAGQVVVGKELARF